MKICSVFPEICANMWKNALSRNEPFKKFLDSDLDPDDFQN